MKFLLCVWPRDYKTFFHSTQMSMKFDLLINVKIVGILAIISRIDSTSEFQREKYLYFSVF